ncbi:MAG: hypothetical protein HY816_19970 [Candidatus Wallbacteria bacterium]|nr:hypothetical protein [Candidatus Wallbacteria bacterium]
MPRGRTARRKPDFRVTLGGQDISADVTSIATNKVFGAPAGSWTVTTSRKNDYTRLPPNTRVKIELQGEASDGFACVCQGLSDRPGNTFSMSQKGTPSAAYRIQGRDLGKLLVTHAIAFDPLIAQSLDANLTALGFGIKASGTAQQVVQKLYQVGFVEKAFAREMMRFGSQQQLDNVVGGSLGRMLQRTEGGFGGLLGDTTGIDIARLVERSGVARHLNSSFQDLTGDITTEFLPTEGEKDDFSVLGESGSMWSVLLRNADCPWNELYTVTEADGRFVLRLRPTPFGTDGRLNSDIPIHDIQPGPEILDEDLGVSDHERVNFISVLPVKNLIDTSTLRLSAGAWHFDESSIMRNGFGNMVVSTPFVSRGDTQSQVEKRTNQLWQWFSQNHTYKTGMLRLRGRNNIVVGEGVRYMGFEYYVEGVSDRFVYPQSFTTTLQLTRGQAIA